MFRVRERLMNNEAALIVEIKDETTFLRVENASHGIVYSRSLTFGNKAFDEAIILHLKNECELLIGERTANAIRMEIGSAFELDKPLKMDVRGRDIKQGVPRTTTLTDSEIREALEDLTKTFVKEVKAALKNMPKEFQAGVNERGIVLKNDENSGNPNKRLIFSSFPFRVEQKRGETLKNLGKRLMIETNLPVTLTE